MNIAFDLSEKEQWDIGRILYQYIRSDIWSVPLQIRGINIVAKRLSKHAFLVDDLLFNVTSTRLDIKNTTKGTPTTDIFIVMSDNQYQTQFRVWNTDRWLLFLKICKYDKNWNKITQQFDVAPRVIKWCKSRETDPNDFMDVYHIFKFEQELMVI